MADSAKKKPPVKRKKKLCMLPLSRPAKPEDIIDRARQYGPACIDSLADVAANGSDMARVSAASTLLDRGFGKVKQGIDHTSSDGSMATCHSPVEVMAELMRRKKEGAAQ